MKHVRFISLFFVAALVLTGCSSATPKETDGENKDSKNQVLICDFSDSVSEATHEREYEFADHEKFDDRKAQQSLELTVGDTTYTGEYKALDYRGCNYFPVYQYADEAGNRFGVDDHGLLVSYFRGTSADGTGSMTEEQCLQIAKDFLGKLVDLSQYDVSAENSTYTNGYTFSFTKVIGNVKTADTASVTILPDGSLYSYSSFMLGRIDKNSIQCQPDVESAIASVQEKLDQVYANAKKTYSRVEYNTPYVELTVLKDGSPALVCYTDVSCIHTVSGYDVVISERIESVVISSEANAS